MDQSPRASRLYIAETLRSRADELAKGFNRSAILWLRQGRYLSPLLEGMIEPFLRRLGEELAARRPDPAAPWAQTRGVLRLSAARGEAGIAREIDLLRRIFRTVAAEDEESQDFLMAALDVLHDGALDEQLRLRDETPRHGAPRFGGLVLEIFEDEAIADELQPGYGVPGSAGIEG